VVTPLSWLLLWLEPESALLEPESELAESSLCVEPESSLDVLSPLDVLSSLELPLLCVELVASSLWLEDPLEEALVVVVVAPPLPSAATASQAATKVASTAAVMRRRTRRRRCLMGGSGDGMGRIVAGFAQILLGASYGAGKNRPAAAYGASKVT
jgi:hypothetical protein